MQKPGFELDFVRCVQSAIVRNAVCLSFGFGGQNAAIVLSARSLIFVNSVDRHLNYTISLQLKSSEVAGELARTSNINLKNSTIFMYFSQSTESFGEITAAAMLVWLCIADADPCVKAWEAQKREPD